MFDFKKALASIKRYEYKLSHWKLIMKDNEIDLNLISNYMSPYECSKMLEPYRETSWAIETEYSGIPYGKEKLIRYITAKFYVDYLTNKIAKLRRKYKSQVLAKAIANSKKT